MPRARGVHTAGQVFAIVYGASKAAVSMLTTSPAAIDRSGFHLLRTASFSFGLVSGELG
jgi:hypothetical protein